MLWPYLTAAIGTLISTVIYAVLFIIMAPLMLIFNRSHMRRSEKLFEQMQDLEVKGQKYSYEYICLEKQYEESEAEIAERGKSLFLILLLVGVILFIMKMVQIIIGLN
ncbi:MAG: hypothetical protein IJ971_07350 [Bacteroidales bacterium]|nr:hypothetical protein [Bacteroidales bacterium]